MDQYGSVLLDFPPDRHPAYDESYDKSARAHVQRLNRWDEAALSPASVARLLDTLDPSVNSLSYLCLLNIVVGTSSGSARFPDDFLDRVITFLLTFDPIQIRYNGASFSRLLSSLQNSDSLPASVAVEVLTTAMLRNDPSGSAFTSHHLPLVKLAYTTDNVGPVLAIIRKDILSFPGVKTPKDSRLLCDPRLSPSAYVTQEHGFTDKVDVSTVLEYDMLCGLCHLARRDWRAALRAFERVMTVPTKEQDCSKIMAEAHSKWVLTCLLCEGKSQPLPSLVGPAVQRAFAVSGKAYLAVAAAFERDEKGAEALREEFDRFGRQFWEDDGNLGLAGEAMSHHQRWQVLNLRDVYSKISFEEIRRRTQSADTGKELEHPSAVEALVQDMISSGMLRGVVEKPQGAAAGDGQGHLTFLPPDEMPETQFAAELASSARRIKELEPVIRATSERLGASRDYIKFLAKEQRREKDNVKDAGVVFESQVEDEDLMTGMPSDY